MNQQALSTQEWLSQYEVLDVIGNGMFGVIKKVKNKRTGEISARKDLNFEKMTEKDRKQIVAEVNILKDLNHEYIVRYHDRFVDRENGYLYILMEYCGGGDLGRVLAKARKQNKPLAEDRVWRYFHQLLLALDHCHYPATSQHVPSTSGGGSSTEPPARRTQQVLHRDLKPENVFVTHDDNLKLGDFGLSKMMGASTLTNTYVGTPYYMSPEMLMEKSYDMKSDMWSLGCLIYELCALQPPFYDAKTQPELTALIRSGRIPPLPRGYSQQLFSTIKSMLNLHPGSRPTVQSLLQMERFRSIEETRRIMCEMQHQKVKLEAREHEVHLKEAEVQKQLRYVDEEKTNLRRAYDEFNRNAESVKADMMRERQAIVDDRSSLNANIQAASEEKKRLVAEKEALERERAQFHAEKTRLTAQLDEETRVYMQHKQELDRTASEFSARYAAFEREKAEFEKQKEQASRQDGGRSKKPFEDIQNQKNTVPLPTRYYVQDDTPIKAGQPVSKRSQDQNIPPIGNGNPPKQTPGSGRRLASKSNPNLGSAMKGVILTASGIALKTPMPGQTHEEAPPVPALPSLTSVLQGRMSLDSPEPAKLATTNEADPARVRLRRRSTISAPLPPAAPQPPLPSAPATTVTFNPATLPPAPVYNLEDEENLPSPFMKKGVAETKASGWRSGLGFKKKTSLLSLAAANAATASSATTTSSKPSSIPTGPSSKSSRASFAKAVKASEDAQKALLRRVT
ncbi:G2-specific serine/threonine protein kinase [Tulasnella sp. 427]|nr:G2-specific serine/threonine protein kinase [Tulasnella sp. 427]